MINVGCFTASVIKKSGYWQKNGNVEAVKENFDGMEVGDSDSISGLIDGQKFHIHEMKNPDYTMMFMTIYETLERSDNEIKWHINGIQCGSSIQILFGNTTPTDMLSMTKKISDNHPSKLIRHGPPHNGPITDLHS